MTLKKIFTVLIIMSLTALTAAAEGASETAQLSALTAVLSGTVSLPEGGVALEDTDICISAIEADKVIIDAGNMKRYSTEVEIPAGSSSADYSIELPVGRYVLEMASAGSCSQTVLGTHYYKEIGAAAELSLADKIRVKKDKVLDMELMAAANSISGAITLAEPLDEAECLKLYAKTYEVDLQDYYIESAVQLPIEPGQTEINYVLPAAAGNTEVYASLTNRANGYFSTTDATTIRPDEDIRYFDTTLYSYENISYVYDNTIGRGATLPITINFNEPVSEDKTYQLRFYYFSPGTGSLPSYHLSHGMDVDVREGDTSVSVMAPSLERAKRRFSDTYRLGLYDPVENIELYYHKTDGLVTSHSFASKIGETVEITMPEYYTLTGTIKRNGVLEGHGIRATMNITRGHKENIYIDADEDIAQYSIKVPKWLERYSGVDLDLHVGTVMKSIAEDVAVEESMERNIVLPSAATVSAEGVIALTKPAPAGGVGVTMEYGNVRNIFFIEEGESELSYNAEFIKAGYVPGETIEVKISTQSLLPEYRTSQTAEIDPDEDNYTEIVAAEYVTVSGNISAPTELSSAITCEMDFTLENDSGKYGCNFKRSVPMGADLTEYEVKMPAGYSIINADIEVEDAGKNRIKEGVENTAVSEASPIDAISGAEGVDFTLDGLPECAVVKVSVPERAEIESGVTVTLGYQCENGISRSYDFLLTGRDTYITLPVDEAEGNLKLWYYTTGLKDELYTEELYYSADGAVLGEENSTDLSVDELIENGLELELVAIKATVSVNLSAPYNYFDIEEEIDCYTVVEFENGMAFGDEVGLSFFSDEKTAVVYIPDIKALEGEQSFAYWYKLSHRYDRGYDYCGYLKEDGGFTTFPVWRVLEENVVIDHALLHYSVIIPTVLEEGAASVSFTEPVLEDGEIDVDIKHTMSDDRQEIYPVFAVMTYDSQGRLVEMSSRNELLWSSGTRILDRTAVPTGEGYTYKMVLWNSLEGMEPVAEAAILE